MNFKLFLSITFFLLLLTSCKQTNEQLLDKAYNLSKQKKYDQAIEVYSEVIKSNSKLQLAYYNRGFAYVATKQYDKALWDFNKVMSLQTHGSLIFTLNQDSPFADEEARTQVPYYDALYQRAQLKYSMDSLKSSLIDFQTLIDNNYNEKSNCLLWQGTIYVRSGKTDKACTYFDNAKQVALTDDDRNEANKMITTYCGKTNNNR